MPLAEAACAPTSLQVSAQVTLLPSEVIPVAWSIDPACAVVETGLLLGTEPTALAPVGQPIYGQRERYEQAIPVAASGRYWVAAYARDEAGEFVQSPPRVVFITVPLPPADDPHGSHGPLPFYTGTNADFLQPAGEPHFASLRGASVTSQFAGSGSVFWPGWSAGEDRGISSTDRNEVLAQQARPFLAGGVSVPVKATDVGTALNRIDDAFRLFQYPRSGLYTVDCDASVRGFGQVVGAGGIASIFPVECRADTSSSGGPRLHYTERDFHWDSFPGTPFFRRETSRASTRSSATYFIPKAPAGKRLQNAKLRVFVSGRGDFSDFSTLRLNGKSPVAVDPVLCSPATNEFPRGYATCSLWATWDFTEAARALSVHGGGELELTLDPMPPAIVDIPSNDNFFERVASYSFQLRANYPWRHGNENNALTLTFGDDCPKELKLKAEPTTIRPQIPSGATLRPGVGKVPSMTMIRATVTTCPSDGNALPPGPVHVAFEVHPPAAKTAQDGGHLHPSTQRPTGTFLGPRLGGGLDNVHCTIETFNEEGMGSCEVPFHSGELSGVETIVGKALDFADAQTSVTIRLLPELKNFRDFPSELYRFVGQIAGRHIDNHWATPATVANATLMAADYFAANKAVLQINDMSLKWGGLFDIDADWLVPHKAHRQGTSVDVDKLACVSSDPSDPGADCSTTKAIPVKVFKELCTGRHGTRAEEATHHCEFLE